MRCTAGGGCLRCWFAIIFCGLPLLGGYALNLRIADLVSKADAVVVGSISGSVQTGDTVVLTLLGERVLKGIPADGSIITVRYSFPADYQGIKAVAKKNARGLFFLLSGGAGGWQLLPTTVGSGTFESTYYSIQQSSAPANYPYTKNAPAIDKVLSELAESSEISGGSDGFDFGLASLEDSPVVATIRSRFAQSPAVDLRAEGLGLMIASGDTAALLQGSNEVNTLAKSRWASRFFSCFSGFRGTDPAAVRELGRLATQATDTPADVRRHTAFALRAIHTKEALPYLVTLLDSSDHNTRADALHGLNAFAVGLPVELPGVNMNKAMDAVMNPGRRQPVEKWPVSQVMGADAGQAIGPYVRFGSFSNPQEESRYIASWKQWWQTYSIRLPQ